MSSMIRTNRPVPWGEPSGVEPAGARPLIVEDCVRVLYYSEDRYGQVSTWVIPDEIGFVRSGDVFDDQ